jgi:hypothetical protein
VAGKTGLFRSVEMINDEESNVTGWIVTESAKVGKILRIARFKTGKDVGNSPR